MADNVKSVSASELTTEVKAAVKKLAIKGMTAEPTIILHPPWICGFILPPDLGGPVENVTSISAKFAAELPSAKGGTPVTLFAGTAGGTTEARRPGPIICGYIKDPTLLMK